MTIWKRPDGAFVDDVAMVAPMDLDMSWSKSWSMEIFQKWMMTGDMI